MNILYICNTDPRDVSGGMQQRSNYIYRALLSIGDVYVVTPQGVGEDIVDGRFAKLRWRCNRGIIQRLVNGLWNRIAGYCHFSWIMISFPYPLVLPIEEAFPGVEFDVVVARYYSSAAKFAAWRMGAGLIIDMDDDPRQVYKTMLAPALPLWRRLVGRCFLELELLWVSRHVEALWYANLPRKHLSFCRRIEVLPNLPPEILRSYDHDAERELAVMTVAAMGYLPNPMGIDKFIDDIWGALRIKFPEIKYYIVGKGTPSKYVEKWKQIEGVHLLGYVEDLEAIYEKVLAAVVPIEQGSGTCIKTLDALRHGRVCISTKFGARGIPEKDLRDGVNGIFIYQDSNEVIQALEKVKDDVARHGFEHAAEQYVERNYSFEAFQGIVGNTIMNVSDNV